MPEFTCTVCGGIVSYSALDEAYFNHIGWRCGFCFRVISENRYPKDIGGNTVFCPIGSKKMGAALGDRTVYEVVKRNYLAGNPSEKVTFLNPEDNVLWAVDELKPNKIFVPEFSHEQLYEVYKRDNVIRYNMLNEVCQYARMKDYPCLEYEPEKPNIAIPENYVVLHIRNIDKDPQRPHPERNADLNLISDIICLLSEKEFNILIVGNDRVEDCFDLAENVYDYRNKLSLPEIAWLMQDHLFIGRDSGMVHVAAAAGAHIFSWAFRSDKWLPKTGIPFVALMEGADNREILFNIERILEDAI